ncbi:MAG: HPF/RaiA family ribosome-associated protein [Bdellovibrionales bacterium]|nr:HPF/RaiA family ribosome-associated protein [Bdellovibrionales bacterium]
MFNHNITFTDFEASESIKEEVRTYLDKIESIYDRVISCDVVISIPHKSSNKPFYHIKINLFLPGEDILVTREAEVDNDHTNIHRAMHDAFQQLIRQLKLKLEKIRQIDVRNIPPHAKITKIFFDEGYGFIETINRREIYFHKNSLVGEKFENLQIGEEVRFNEEQGFKGPQVTSMSLVGKQNRMLS